MMTDATQAAVITANLEAIEALLAEARARAAEAHALALSGERNGAIGAVLGLDALLEDACALYRAAIAIHRAR